LEIGVSLQYFPSFGLMLMLQKNTLFHIRALIWSIWWAGFFLYQVQQF